MFDWIKENVTAFIVALVLHLVFLGALFFNWQMDKPKKIVMKQGDIVQVSSVDANTYDAEIKKIEEKKSAEKRRKAQAERKARELKKKKQQEKKRKAKELKEKKAAAVRKKELKEKKRKEAEKKAADDRRKKEEQKKEVKRKEDARKKAEQEKKRQEAEQKRKVEEEKKRQAELQRKEQRERAERERRSKGIVNRHVTLITNKIERNWRQPLDAPSGLQCRTDISLRPSGDVVSVKMVESSGNQSFDRSCETAVWKASPLPVPTDSVIFEKFKVMRLKFKPGSY